MTKTTRSCVLLAFACTLAACGSDKSGTSAASGSNEVLQGTISDEMIPYDTLRSQPPPAKIATEGTGSGSAATRAPAGGEAAEAAAQDGAAANDATSTREQNGAPAPVGEND